VGLLGGAAALVGDAVVIVGGGFVALGALTAYTLGDRKDPGLTGEVALVATYVLGVLAKTEPTIALESGILMTALLAFRTPLHRFVRERITDQELLDALIFAIAAIVILPVLPNRAVDPFGLLNPYTLWRLAVVAMGLNFAGYVAQRLLGRRFGLLIAGLAAGLVSSTAAVAAMGARTRDNPDQVAEGAAGAVASMIGSLAYLAAIIWAVSPELALWLAAPLGASAIVMLGYALWLVRRPGKSAAGPEPGEGAFSLITILLFVALVGGFSMVAEFLMRWLGAPGVLVGATIMGLADAHATSVSMATLVAGGERLPAATAAIGVVLTLTANMGIKIPTAYVAGSRAYGRRVTIGVMLLLAGLWSGGLLIFFAGEPLFGLAKPVP
jgi:uncharacterized membrane protein (DUF4010 family)